MMINTKKWRKNTMRFFPVIRNSNVPSRIWPETTQLFDEFFNDLPLAGWNAWHREDWTPAVDILEKEGNLILRAEVPGMNQKDIDLKLEGNVLTMKGERKMSDEEKNGSYRRVESYYGSFTRSFTLPETVDRDKIRADYKDGVLTITIPQKPEIKPREIPVSVH
jgi:HSP20 family protein